MYYDKQIRYIDYLENGEKQRNCGYVKMTVTDNRLLLEMQIKGLYETDDVASEVVLEGIGAERRIGTVLIRQGSGSFQWELKDPVHTGEALVISDGLCYGQLMRVHVQLSPRRSLRCVWREAILGQQTVRWKQQSVHEDIGADTPEHRYEDVLQIKTGIENGDTKREGKASKDPAVLRVGIIQPVTENMEKTAEPQGFLSEIIVQAAAEEEQSTAGGVGTGKDNEKTMLEGNMPGGSSGKTAMGGFPAGRDHEKTRLGENAVGRYMAEENEMDRADSSIRTEKESVGSNMRNLAEEKIQSGTANQAGDEVSGATREEMVREGATKEGMVREGAIREGMGREGATREGMGREGATREGMGREGMAREGMMGEDATEEAELHQTDALEVPEESSTASKGGRESQPPQMASMSEDKWQQLWKIYPHIRPFQDERQYLSLRPEDFVILHSGAYRLVQNSFLLHGYFNYDHLILTQVSRRNGNQYYIGVPGNFYEKEKQVAIMYGFGSFECRQEPAQEGDFGYYMIKVEL